MTNRIAYAVFLGLLGALPIAPSTASAQVLRLAELTTEQIRALNRDKTIVIIPGGILEEHGPFLPSFTDASDILFIRPDLVAPAYKTARSLPGKNWDELVRIAQAPGWPGYFGAPTQATPAEGRTRIQQRSRVAADLMWRIVDGADERDIPRWTAMMSSSEAIAKVDAAEGAHERAREARFAAWLMQRGKR